MAKSVEPGRAGILRAEHGALKAARGQLATKEGRRRYARRAGVEGTLSQGVRAFGLRRGRYRGLAKTGGF